MLCMVLNRLYSCDAQMKHKGAFNKTCVVEL